MISGHQHFLRRQDAAEMGLEVVAGSLVAIWHLQALSRQAAEKCAGAAI